MSEIDDIVSQLPISQLAQAVGANESDTQAAVQQAVPALLGGMQANAQEPGGAQSLLEALGQHQGGTPDPAAVNPAEGNQIVGHIFGDNQDAVVNKLGGLPGINGGLMQKLLPILAPIVLSYISSRVLNQGGGAQGSAAPSTSDPSAQQAPAGGLGDILGSILGGGAGAGTGSAGPGAALPGGLGDILGGLLGGGRK